MTKFFKIKKKAYCGIIFEHILSLLPKRNFFQKIYCTTAVVPQHLNVKGTE